MGCRPSKADNDTAAMHMLSKTDSDYIRQAKADISGGDGEEQGVHSVESAAMTGDKITEILYANHALEQGLSQITYLAHGGGQQGSAYAKPHGDGVGGFKDKIDNHTGDSGTESAGYTAFHSLFWADMGGDFMLAKEHAVPSLLYILA